MRKKEREWFRRQMWRRVITIPMLAKAAGYHPCYVRNVFCGAFPGAENFRACLREALKRFPPVLDELEFLRAEVKRKGIRLTEIGDHIGMTARTAQRLLSGTVGKHRRSKALWTAYDRLRRFILDYQEPPYDDTPEFRRDIVAKFRNLPCTITESLRVAGLSYTAWSHFKNGQSVEIETIAALIGAIEKIERKKYAA